LVTGVGGTGVVTVGALITMAAHLQGLGASVLDFTGFAQKFGPVLSFIRLAPRPGDINQVRIDARSADAVIACDVVVSSSPKASATYSDRTRMVLNRAEMPTGDIVRRVDADLAVAEREAAIAGIVGQDNLSALDANRAAERLFGDAVFANVIMLGFAWQKGLVPVSLEALDQAIELNGVAVEKNRAAFAAGRVLAARPELLDVQDAPARPETMDDLIARRAEFLAGYQDAAYAERYRARLAAFRAALPADAPDALLEAAAKSLFKLMAYKDEYEVARLMTAPEFRNRLEAEFEGDFAVKYHLAPPLIPTGRDARGRPRKRSFGRGMEWGFRLLARLKGLRGSWADPFGHTAERRAERALIGWYEGLMDDCATRYGTLAPETWREVLEAPMRIRGYGPVKAAAMAEVKAQVAELMAGEG
ncbi:MAG: pyruvate ferredoxin oxidoreductase, partial [Alphaproteobacteria bacterium]